MVQPDSHFRYLRMSKEFFDVLLSDKSCINILYGYRIYTNWTHNAILGRPTFSTSVIRYGLCGISPSERLVLTLKFLATGTRQVRFF